MNRVKSFSLLDFVHDDKEPRWNTSAKVKVPGLGIIEIENCITTETLEKIKFEVLFTLEQKLKKGL